MRGLSLACLVLFLGVVAAAPQEEGVTAEEATTRKLELEPFTTTVPSAADPTEAPTSAPEVSEPSTPAPVVILKQINEINEDGTYTVGYEAADGTFKLETKDEEGNVKGKYGYLDEFGDLKIVEYSANNSTGFTNDAGSAAGSGSPTQTAAFELERERHEAVLKFQADVVAKQQEEAARRAAAVRRQQFANQPNQRRNQRPVFNAANFNPNQDLAQQFDTRGFNQQFEQQQQFAPQQQQQQQQFNTNFQNFQPQQFVEQRRQQFAQTQQQFAQQPQQFAQQPQQQFAPQQPRQQQFFEQPRNQFAPQQARAPAPTPAPLIPVAQLTEEDIRLHGFSRDEDQDGQIDPLPAHLAHLEAAPAPPPQRFAPQQPQFAPQQQFAPRQQFAPQQPQFRQPAPVAPRPAGRPQQAAPQLSQQQLNQFFAQAQQQQQQFAPQQQQQFAPQQRFAPQQQQQFQF